ncbi:cytochrome c-type biogenesis protein CcmH [Marinomonas sp. 15G1-11]|uniref:Cytochrome c-type biogenesis protein n=1 Tax=Marinomonas phaeophyticola TaxID=3004091 RepID=A0ABT4JYH2_9GAMM|nr:cytochrome c-type biogenesis protein [Marinomonas sp. 15G1-11]MCZ2723328.1 cytochrome c-type biogenesis protein CcmH [Marinomonas sp. 15G1-11]
MRYSLFFCLIALFSTTAFSEAESILKFNSSIDETRYNALIEELRCPKCQNQNLADSNAGIAVDLRNQIYSMIDQGLSDKEIVDYMVARYGEFVLYKPANNAGTFLLWYGPLILLAFGLLAFVLIIRSNRKSLRKETK